MDKKIGVYFDPDKLDILSVVDESVVLRGAYSDYVNKTYGNDCIIFLERPLFIKAMEDWLDNKADYYKRCNHYCGSGDIRFNYVKEQHMSPLLTCPEYGEDKYDGSHEVVMVRTFICKDAVVDMEHG